jgi:hydroxyacylglutathione hydrolase
MKIDSYEVVQIDTKSWYIEDDIVRAFLFIGEKRALLVDTTNGSGNLKAVVESLTKLPVILVNTHADGDHIGCNWQFEETFMHPAEFAHYAIKSKEGDAIPKPILEGDIIDIGERQFEVIFTPGHTSGSIVLLDRKNRILIGGDTILEYMFIFGQFRNLRALISSLEHLKNKYWDAFETIYASHFAPQVDKELILRELACAKAHLEGKLEGVDPGPIPLEPPDFRPAKMYQMDGAAFFDY